MTVKFSRMPGWGVCIGITTDAVSIILVEVTQ